jgi:hypothetical protein
VINSSEMADVQSRSNAEKSTNRFIIFFLLEIGFFPENGGASSVSVKCAAD